MVLVEPSQDNPGGCGRPLFVSTLLFVTPQTIVLSSRNNGLLPPPKKIISLPLKRGSAVHQWDISIFTGNISSEILCVCLSISQVPSQHKQQEQIDIFCLCPVVRQYQQTGSATSINRFSLIVQRFLRDAPHQGVNSLIKDQCIVRFKPAA